jgi:hypothetical protein
MHVKMRHCGSHCEPIRLYIVLITCLIHEYSIIQRVCKRKIEGNRPKSCAMPVKEEGGGQAAAQTVVWRLHFLSPKPMVSADFRDLFVPT